MYQPTLFQEGRIDVMHDLMRAYPFAAIVTSGEGGLVANHLPFLLKCRDTEFGVLEGHVARENPIWRDRAREVLVIFNGPQHYITPSWYPSKREHGKVVPTWNYAVVHAHGLLCVHEEEGWLRGHLQELVAQHEAGRDQVWTIDNTPDDFIAAMLKDIVGFEVKIEKLQGKWKVSQNRNEADRSGVVRGLKSEGTPFSVEMSELIRA
jgi:transcriptional regulator